MKTKLNIIVSDYFATGEGRVISLFISNSNTEDALEQFTKTFDQFYTMNSEYINKEKLLLEYKHLLPQHIISILESEKIDYVFQWYSQFYFNLG